MNIYQQIIKRLRSRYSLFKCYPALCALLLLPVNAQGAHHGEGSQQWVLSANESKVAYLSIKKETVGELNHFSGLSGGIAEDGKVLVDIDLSTVETYIDIRNQRMAKHVFGDHTKATLQAALNMGAVNQLALGATMVMDVEGELSLMGKQIPVEVSILAARLSDTRILLATDEMITVSTKDLGVDKGVSTLMEIAKLPSITRTVPVTLRMVFEKQGGATVKKAAVQSLKASAKSGNKAEIAAGKKIYRQCQGCHNAKSPEHSIGPHLVGVINRKAGAVEGFAFSEATKASGLTWDEENLAAFLTDPAGTIPNNTMPYAGIKDQVQVKSLIAYLKSVQK